MKADALPAHLSLHDVAPETLTRVDAMLERLRQTGIDRAMLLVIPGRDWRPDQLRQLRDWAGRGHVLAGHGWHHRVDRRRTFKHKVHGLLISRFVAEHLSLSREEILELMRRNYDWFAAHDLPSPTHYVPPAWALGPVGPPDLRGLPFRTVETLGGVFRVSENRFQKLPLLGYEADTAFRARFLRTFNTWNRVKASPDRPTRIGLHPDDLSLRLSADLLSDCRRFTCRAEIP